jgi:hypothetical protein
MTSHEPDFQRADKLMDERRQQLDMMWKDVAATAKMSYQSLLDFRQGKTNPRRLTKRRIDAALRWDAGSLQAVLEGGDPTPLPEERAAIQAVEASEQGWILSDPRARAILAADVPLAERVQGVRDLIDADLRRLQERLEREEQRRETG